MRFEGTITQWNQDRGFGFIQPTQGGQNIFVHISALPQSARSAPLHRAVLFEVEHNAKGEKRARHVQLAPTARPRPQRHYQQASAPSAGWLAIAALLGLYLLAALRWHMPHSVALLYGGSSAVCAVAYALDKSAAQSGRWRIKESTLLMLGLVGGWPGAIVAQQWLRHKTQKRSFRLAFWATVFLNLAGLVLLASPQGRAWIFALR